MPTGIETRRPRWRGAFHIPALGAVLFGVLVGLPIGLGGFTFVYAKGYSYLANDPAACANCHIMQDHLDAWQKGSHKAVATCNDCHAPHDLIGKYTSKARNGFAHSFAFTTGWYPDPLRLTEYNRRIIEHACRDCHSELTESIDAYAVGHTQELSCLRCHPTVGHDEER